jgi:hypothetical protein
MALHHIMPKHVWKKRFGNLRGINSFDNVVELTTEQHALAHKFLYELHGDENDRIAYLGISGQIGREEAKRLATIAANTGNKHCLGRKNGLGYKHTEAAKAKIAEASLGRRHSALAREKISNARMGMKFSEEHKRNMSASKMGSVPWNKGKKHEVI